MMNAFGAVAAVNDDAWSNHTGAAGRYSDEGGDDEDEEASPEDAYDGEEFEGQVRD